MLSNVAVGAARPCRLLEHQDSDRQDIVSVNTLFTLELVHTLLPQLLANSAHDRRCALVLVSSLSAAMPAPFVSVYAATKAFLCSLAESIRAENAHVPK